MSCAEIEGTTATWTSRRAFGGVYAARTIMSHIQTTLKSAIQLATMSCALHMRKFMRPPF